MSRTGPGAEAIVDVVVVGAGPAACAFATSAARAGRTVAMVGTPTQHAPGTLELVSGRTSNALRRLGLVDAVAAIGMPAESTMFRWGRSEFGVREMPAEAWGTDRIIDRGELDALLFSTARASVSHLVTGTVARIAHDGHAWTVTCSCPAADGDLSWHSLRARNLAIASGRTAKVGARTGLQRVVRHRMTAITAWLPRSVLDLSGRMLVDATEAGWWYALGNDAGTQVGFVTDVDLLRPGTDRARATWSGEAAAREWLPDVADQELRLRPAIVADVVGGDGNGTTDALLPLGDAAVAADPMSGHGLIIALDGATRAASDPQGYGAWVRRVQAAHREQELALYRAETRFAGATFWQRRHAPA